MDQETVDELHGRQHQGLGAIVVVGAFVGEGYPVVGKSNLVDIAAEISQDRTVSGPAKDSLA
jgi:hypothetical protein